jgi:hypothetical protein
LASKRSTKPQARSESLVVSEVKDEVLVYDLTQHRAHTLNPSAALIWRNCDGKHTVEDLAALLNTKLELPADEESVWSALSLLDQADLLHEPVSRPVAEGASRRLFLKRAGLAAASAAGAATVLSISAPRAFAQAATGSCPGRNPATCKPLGATCNSGSDCCSCFCIQFDDQTTKTCVAG